MGRGQVCQAMYGLVQLGAAAMPSLLALTEDPSPPLRPRLRRYIAAVHRASGKTAQSVGENGPGGTLARAGLDLLDAWSDGNATPHDR